MYTELSNLIKFHSEVFYQGPKCRRSLILLERLCYRVNRHIDVLAKVCELCVSVYVFSIFRRCSLRIRLYKYDEKVIVQTEILIFSLRVEFSSSPLEGH